MNLFECFMRQSTCYKGTTIGKPVGVLWHDTGAGNPNLKRYVQPDDNEPNRESLLRKLGVNNNKNDWNHISLDAGLNAFIGKCSDGSIATVQTMPWNYRAWGCGSGKNGSCNGNKDVANSPFWIQFEICDDFYKDATYFRKVYQEACEFTAFICNQFGIDPKGTVKYNGVIVPTILCHADSYKLGLGSNHGDVLGWFSKYGKTMDNVRNDVESIIKNGKVVIPDQIYRIRKSWEDVQSQIGAYKNLDAAKKECPEGYAVYDKNGNEVYRMAEIKKDNTPADWAKDAVEWATKNNVLKGDKNGDLKLHSTLTREELVVILKRYDEVKNDA